ncbi:uncharacterized protein LOC111630266 [Centruroides sculpturatus]|uniref:uncharacterized protein LOC111630266 n=1 Tax=Centruroides sculpturatus TaxID=218467 RepID=UPI000C6DB942|nr:uncharacterized protein LOC111630266 [Centruroides sculpturatus]
MTSPRQCVTRLTNLPKGQGHCNFVAVHSLNNGKCLAQDPLLNTSVTPAEINIIKHGFESINSLFTTGISLAGSRFIFLTKVDNVLYGKKRDLGCIIKKCQESDSVLIVIHSCKEEKSDILMEMSKIFKSCEETGIC